MASVTTGAPALVQCTNCKVKRAATEFVGVDGRTVKRCAKCRAKDAKNKSRPDKREKHAAHLRETRPDIASRERRRAADEDAYLEDNAQAMREWRAANKEHVSSYKKMNVRARVGAIEARARTKGIAWDESMNREHCAELVKNACFYCGAEPATTLNGFDRMDSTAGYHANNCVPCCRACNFMKKSLDARTFVERSLHISRVHGAEGTMFSEAWHDHASRSSVFEYMARAAKKGLEFALTVDEFEQIASGACHYCLASPSSTHVNGVDRMDNELGYTRCNAVACCKECNHMKADMSAEQFIDHAKRVAAHVTLASPRIPRMPRQRHTVLTRAGAVNTGDGNSNGGADDYIPLWVLQHVRK